MFPKNVSQNVPTFILNLAVCNANLLNIFSTLSLFSKSEIGRLFQKKNADF